MQPYVSKAITIAVLILLSSVLYACDANSNYSNQTIGDVLESQPENEIIKKSWQILKGEDIEIGLVDRSSAKLVELNGKLVTMFDMKDNKLSSGSGVVSHRYVVVYAGLGESDRIRIVDKSIYINPNAGSSAIDDLIGDNINFEENSIVKWYTLREYKDLLSTLGKYSEFRVLEDDAEYIQNINVDNSHPSGKMRVSSNSSVTNCGQGESSLCWVTKWYDGDGNLVSIDVHYCWCEASTIEGGGSSGGGTPVPVEEIDVDYTQFTVNGDVSLSSDVMANPGLDQCTPGPFETVEDVLDRPMTGSATYRVTGDGYTNLDLTLIERALVRIGSALGNPDYTTDAKLNATVSGAGANLSLSDDDYRYAYDQGQYIYQHNISTGIMQYIVGTHIGEVRSGGAGDVKIDESDDNVYFKKWFCEDIMGEMTWPGGGEAWYPED